MSSESKQSSREPENQPLNWVRDVAAKFLGGVTVLTSAKGIGFEEAEGRATELLGGKPYTPPYIADNNALTPPPTPHTPSQTTTNQVQR